MREKGGHRMTWCGSILSPDSLILKVTKFRGVGIFLCIPMFRGLWPIKDLRTFSVRYHPQLDQVRNDLVEWAHRFRDLAGSHIQYFNGNALLIKKGKHVKMNINSQVAMDAAFSTKCSPIILGQRCAFCGLINVIAFRSLTWMQCSTEGVNAKKRKAMREVHILIAFLTVCCFKLRRCYQMANLFNYRNSFGLIICTNDECVAVSMGYLFIYSSGFSRP